MATALTDFDPNHPDTWPLTLFIEHVAAIRGLSTNWVSRMAARGVFRPAPVRGGERGHRWEWRKADVERFVLGERPSDRLRWVV